MDVLAFVRTGNAEATRVALRSATWVRTTGQFPVLAAPARKPLLIAAAAWLIALAAVGVLVRTSLTISAQHRLLDLNVYRNGGLSVLHDSPLYALRSRAGLLFTYPPVAAVLAVGLGLMSWRTAGLAWIPVIYIPLAIAVWHGFRPLLVRARSYGPAVLAGLFGCCAYLMPMRQETHYGQVDILLVALCVLDCAAQRPRWPRGALIGLATAIKLVPGVFIVYLLITGRRKAAGVATLTFAALSGLAWVISPQDSARYWSSAIFNSRRLGPNMQAANQSLRGMILRVFSPAAAPPVIWLTVALLVGVAGFWIARRVHRSGHEMAGIAVTGLLAALLSPVAWIHHFCWIVLALGVIVGDGRSPRRVAAAGAMGALFISILPLWGKQLLTEHAVPVVLARALEDTFGLAALALIVIIYRISRTTQADPGQTTTSPELGRSAVVIEGMTLAGSRDR
jgi:alpha-1,2-mannosyltransferase